MSIGSNNKIIVEMQNESRKENIFEKAPKKEFK